MKAFGLLLILISFHSTLFAFVTPHSFSPGTKISSAEINDNFQTIETELNDRTSQTILKLNVDFTVTATCDLFTLTSADLSAVENDGNYADGVYTASKRGLYQMISVQANSSLMYSVKIFKNNTYNTYVSSYNGTGYFSLNVGESVDLRLYNNSMSCATPSTLLQSDSFFIIKKVANLP